MSNAPQARAAHMRHANRAGGFGDFTFPGFGFLTETEPETEPRTKKTKTNPETTSTSASAESLPITSSSSSSTTSSSVVSSSSIATSSSVLSTTSTTTTSTTTSESSTSTPVAPTTTYSGTALHDNFTKVITHLVSASSSALPAASSSSVPTPSNAIVAPVIGGVAGGILGLVGLFFLLTFCLRRRRKDKDHQEALNFDPSSFRRSAMLIAEPPTHQDTVARGYNPPAPPPMVERRQLYPASPNYNPHSPEGLSPTSGNPLVFQAPFSPISPTATSPVSAYDHSWPAPVLTRNASAISAVSSVSSAHEYAQYAQAPAPPGPRNSLPIPQNENEYIDLERNSVTPFQAAQYVEISKRLNTEVPKGLDTPAINEFVVSKMPTKDAELPPLPPQDPFADRDSDDDEEAPLPMVQELSFPSPPSPVRANSSRYRVDSTPPTLPEIIVQSRVSVTSTYLSEGGSSPFGAGFPAGQTLVMKGASADSPMGSRFPVTPSPLASSFTVPSPPAAATSFPAEPAAAQPRPDSKQRQPVYTVYDPEDAYGGF
ncbi:hypothetical protein DFH09DRAFT_1279368 [Mycena vulgaris]|nr:hypothetical protein DFH09DRAFT_1279368 [Mycena vulgaris]